MSSVYIWYKISLLLLNCQLSIANKSVDGTHGALPLLVVAVIQNSYWSVLVFVCFYLSHCSSMGQIIKSPASLCLSVHAPMVAIFVRIWWNFAQKSGVRSMRKVSLGVKIRLPLPLFSPIFHPHNAFSIRRPNYRSNKAPGPILAVKTSNDAVTPNFAPKTQKWGSVHFQWEYAWWHQEV